MSTLIANPIYDSVFKYMIANEKVAKILLSALLKKRVVKVVQLRNEYNIPVSDTVTFCRIDFGATVSEEIVLPDGKTEVKESMVTIELQKVYLPSEVLRFRQYTGTHYCDPAKVHPVDYGTVKEAADPMVSVYILGHKLDVIDECVCYISREYRDYNGNKLDMRDPFAESLTHDSIIVQVPLLPNGNVKNRAEELLQVINQSRRTNDQHFLAIDEEMYSGDEEMLEVIRTLKGAACDYDIRRRMMLEDEILGELKNKDLAIAKQMEQLMEQEAQIAKQDEQLMEQEAQIAKQDEQIAEHMKQLVVIAKNLKDTGKSITEISKLMGVDKEYVGKMLGE